MSIEAVRAVLESSEQKGNARLLLLAIAEHADKDGVSFPGNECLAQETKLTLRHVQRLIAHLADNREIEILQPGNGRGIKRMMRLTVDKSKKGDVLMSPFSANGAEKRVTFSQKKGDILSQKGDIFDRKGDIAMSPEPYNQKQPTTEPTTLPLSAALAETPKGKTKKAKAQESPEDLDRRRNLYDAWLPASDAKNFNKAQANAGIKQLDNAGCTPEELIGCAEWMRLEPYWSLKTIYPQSIFKKLDEYRRWLERKANTYGNGYGASASGGAGTYNANGRTQPGQSAQNGARAGGATGGLAASNGASSGGSLSEAERKRQFELASTKLTAQLVNKRIDDAEYQRQYTNLRSTYGLSNLPGSRSLSPS